MSSTPLSNQRITRRQGLILAENRLLQGFPSNVEISVLKVRAKLDPEKLRHAWDVVVRKFDCLRAQINADGADIGFTFSQTGPAMSFAERSTDELTTELRTRFAQPFQQGETLARAAHVRTPEGDVIVVGQSHVVTDGTTKSMIFDTLGCLYLSDDVVQPLGSDLEDFLATLEIDPVQERESKAFWDQTLATPASDQKLFGQAPHPKRGALETSSVPIDADLAQALMARPDGRSPSLAMTAVVAALLHRITGEESIALGVPFANRSDATKGIGGLFMEIVPNRVLVDPSDSLANLASAISASAKDMRPHRQYAVSGALSGHEAMLNYRPSVVDEFAGFPAEQSFLTAPHILSPDTAVDQTGGVGLLFEVMRDKAGAPFEMVLHVDVARWPQQGLGARILAHFTPVLRAMIETPELAIGAIDVVGETSADLILSPVPDDPFPDDMPTVVQALRAQARATPEKTAFQFGSTDLSYRDVVAQLDAIASNLTDRGVGPGTRVAVCLPRSEALPVVLLGIMETGAAYVPLDPSHAKSRLDLILKDAAPTLVVVDESSAATLQGSGYPTARLDELSKATGATVPTGGATLDQPAYIIFTSGSTGRPKGVQVSHRNLATFLTAMTNRPGLDPATRLLAVTTISFDIAALEMFGPIVAGGSVVIASEQQARGPQALARIMADDDITLLQATPATWQMLVSSGWQNKAITALTGGEALPEPLAEALVTRCKSVWNMYGPTETTIWSMTGPVEAGKPVRLGAPIQGTRVSLRTDQGSLVPEGVPGEIVIEGAGVADGYFERPDLTAERFLGDGQDRRYRTGDLAVLETQPDPSHAPTLRYLGRSDHQVKVRGFRVELGEIEAQIAAVAGTTGAVVTTVPGAMGAQALAAYWTGANDQATLDAIRDRLRDALPSYMHPQSLTHLDTFPQNTNGKIDRKALPPPDAQAPTMGLGDATGASQDAQPQTEEEFQLTERIAKVVGFTGVPVNLPIRDVGLDSLSFLTLSLDLERQLGRSMPSGWEEMTIRELARLESADQTLASMPMSVLVRALLMIDIVAGHFGLFGFSGSIQGLFLAAGHSFGRFVVPASTRAASAWPILTFVGNIVLPTCLAVLFLQVFFGRFSLSGVFLVANYSPPDGHQATNFWFVEVLVQCMLILALLISVPQYRGFISKRPFETALATLFGFYAMNLAIGAVWNTDHLFNRVPHDKLWLIALGWCVAVARTSQQMRIITVVSIALIGFDTLIGGHFRVQAGLALAALILFDHVKIPRLAARLLLPISAASLFIYLTHFQFLTVVRKLPAPLDNEWVALPVALVGGVVVYRIWEALFQLLRNTIMPRRMPQRHSVEPT